MYALIPCGIVVYMITLKALPLFSLYDRLAIYSKQNTDLNPVPLLSVYLLARVVSLGIVVGFCWNKLSVRDRHIVLCSGISLLLFLSLSSWDTLAWRASEIFGLFDMAVFLIPLAYFRCMFWVCSAWVLSSIDRHCNWLRPTASKGQLGSRQC
ncbi:MAG: hypothetical protein V4587_11190 [Acidobacteriota bacterium]